MVKRAKKDSAKLCTVYTVHTVHKSSSLVQHMYIARSLYNTNISGTASMNDSELHGRSGLWKSCRITLRAVSSEVLICRFQQLEAGARLIDS